MQSFFGLTENYMEAVYEQFFYMKYSGGWSFAEAYNLPIGLRKWFFDRLIRQLEAEKESAESASKGKKGSQTLTANNQPRPPNSLK